MPAPRIFVLHIAWVSQRADRNPIKKAKDLNQGIAVAALVKQFLQQYPFDRDFIAMLSNELRESYELQIEPVIAQLG